MVLKSTLEKCKKVTADNPADLKSVKITRKKHYTPKFIF